MADVVSTSAYVLGQQAADAVRQAIANRGGLQKASALYSLAPQTGVFFTVAGSTPPVVASGKTCVSIIFDNTTLQALADKGITWVPPTGSMPS